MNLERLLVVNHTILWLMLAVRYVLEHVPGNLLAAEISDRGGRPQNARFLDKIHRE